MKAGRCIAVAALSLGSLGVSTSTAFAAAPSNDTFGGATPVTAGFSEVLDTTGATTDSNDAQANGTCGAPATDASVWYAIVGADNTIVVDVSQSNYTAGVLVGVGTEGALQTEACGPGAVVFFAAAGTTYYVLAFDDQQDGRGNGGSLSISFNNAPPAPTVDITVNRVGTVITRSGIANISGTLTCTNADSIDVFVDASQRVGRGSVIGVGQFFASGVCDGAPHTWSAAVFPTNGKFAGGKTMTMAFSFACGTFQCSDGFAQQTVQLRGGK